MLYHAANHKPKLLFIGESVSLAHVSRPYALASSLDQSLFDIHFAADDSFRGLCDTSQFPWHLITSMKPQEFLTRLKRGHLLYNKQTLAKYISNEMDLLSTLKPRIVIGDMRISLGISAQALGIPYIAITNAHWNKYALQHDVIPPYKLLQQLGLHKLKNNFLKTIAHKLLRLAKPCILATHLRPINQLRKKYGLQPFSSFFDGFTYGTLSLFADTPLVSPLTHTPKHCRYIGPVIWSPTTTQSIYIPDSNTPYIYATFGSTGDSKLIKKLVIALKDIPYRVYLASVSKYNLNIPYNVPQSNIWPSNFIVRQYLNGEELARNAKLVICNGGCPTAHQALAHGVPVLGIANNLDQLLIMHNIEKAHGGKLLRADCATPTSIRKNTMDILLNPTYKLGAGVIAKEFANYNSTERFRSAIDEILNIEAPLKRNIA